MNGCAPSRRGCRRAVGIFAAIDRGCKDLPKILASIKKTNYCQTDVGRGVESQFSLPKTFIAVFLIDVTPIHEGRSAMALKDFIARIFPIHTGSEGLLQAALSGFFQYFLHGKRSFGDGNTPPSGYLYD